MTHTLAPATLTHDGYSAACSCGWESVPSFTRSSADSAGRWHAWRVARVS